MLHDFLFRNTRLLLAFVALWQKPQAVLVKALLLFTLFCSQPGFAQVTATITGTTPATATYHAGPIYRSSASSAYDASRYSYLFTAAELTSAGIPSGAIITKVAWNKTNNAATTATAQGIFDIYMKNSAATDFSATSVPWATQVSGATQVYASTTQTIPAAIGWVEFPLSSNFTYTGGSLEISTDWDINQASGSPTTAAINWEVSTITDRIYGISNTGTPTANLSSTSNSIGNLNDMRPNIQITYISVPCTAPPTAGTAVTSATTICAGQSFTLNLTGASLGLNQTYQWETSPNGTTGWTAVGTSSNSPSLTTSQLSGTHYYRAAVTCSGQTANSSVVSVTSPAQVSGIFTINKNAPASATNFITFADAISYLACGINGSVTLNVVTGTGPYTEQVVIPAIFGTSATNTITINGNGNTISATPLTGARAIVKLDGADYVTINNLMIESNGTYGWGIHFMNGADNNTISNNTITINSTSTTEVNIVGIVFTNSASAVSTNGNNGSNNLISGNTIIGGYKGIHLNGDATSATASAGNNQIINNNIRDFYASGIELDQAKATTIKNNDISRPTRTGVTTFYGINMSDNTIGSTIDGNRIHNTHGGATSLTGIVYGINTTTSDATAGMENIIKNNLIYGINNTGTAYGLYNTGSDGVYYFHNTVNLDNAASTGIARGFHQTTIASNIKFFNNNISINTGAPFADQRALYFNTVTSVIQSNNNNLYVPKGTIGIYNGVTYPTLTDWKTANPTAPFDINSVSANPHYVNAAAGNLQPTAFALNNIGQPLAAVTLDITGATRSTTTPDPGAYEFTIVATDMGISANVSPASGCGLTANEDVTITVFNYGSATQSNIPVSYRLNNGTAVTGTVPGPIASGASVNFTFPTKVNLSVPATYTLKVYTGLTGDSHAYNDTVISVINALPVITTFPYSQGFENGNGGWIAAGRNNSWALGTPAKTVINSAASGTKSWVTNLTGNHPAFESSAVTSPCFNFSTLVNPSISMKVWWSIEDDWDGAVLQSSIDGGATWQVVGQFGDPNNWYNSDSIDANPGEQPASQNGRFIGWSGTGTLSSGGWVTASHALTGLGGQANVRLRVAFASDLYTEEDGFAFDDVTISESVATPTITAGGATTFCAGGSVALTATSTTSGVTYQWFNNGNVITGATAATYSATASGNYTVVAYLSSNPSTASAATTVTVNAAPATPTIAAGSATTFCSGGSVTLTGSTTTTGATYTWSLNGTVIPGATAATYTANAAGSYTVTASANGCTATSVPTVVTVNAKPATPTITLTGNTLTASTTTGTYQWFSVAGTTLTQITGATSATFTPSVNGSYTVVVTVNGCESDAATATPVVLGIASMAPGMDVSVYPNPTAGKFAVNLVGFEKEATIQIMNVAGQVVSTERVAITSDKTSKAFNLSGMAKGVYILKVTSGDNITFRKVILD